MLFFQCILRLLFMICCEKSSIFLFSRWILAYKNIIGLFYLIEKSYFTSLPYSVYEYQSHYQQNHHNDIKRSSIN